MSSLTVQGQSSKGEVAGMFTRISRRFTYVNVAMTVALVFAMSGGAYAAGKYLITSTKQISPKVLKSLQGKTGKAGANGAPGPAGPTGPGGAAGANGKDGVNGVNGQDGAPGPKGDQGEPWTAGGTLPAGKTETGTWTYNLETEGESGQLVSVSFPIPLAEPLEGGTVHYILVNGKEWDFGTETEVTSSECLGSVSAPKAAVGNLCVYASALGTIEGFQVPAPSAITNPSKPQTGTPTLGASANGAILQWGPMKLKMGYGTWAVTAE
jgi:hypothetical protein